MCAETNKDLGPGFNHSTVHIQDIHKFLSRRGVKTEITEEKRIKPNKDTLPVCPVICRAMTMSLAEVGGLWIPALSLYFPQHVTQNTKAPKCTRYGPSWKILGCVLLVREFFFARHRNIHC